MSPDFRLSGLAGALALALAAAAPMAASADEPVMATGQVGTKITLGPTNLPWNLLQGAADARRRVGRRTTGRSSVA